MRGSHSFHKYTGVDQTENITLIIDQDTLSRYEDYYFSIHKSAKKKPIKQPYHESINQWMIMRRPMMNALKQRWKDFITWFVAEQGYANLRISRCEIGQTIYYQTNRRHDIDNTVPKFVLDGLVGSGMIVDDDSKHITKLTLECGVDREHPRTEIRIAVYDRDTESKGDSTDGERKEDLGE